MTVVPFLLLGRPFGRGNGLEPLVRDRSAALDGKAVFAGGESRLGALDGREGLAQLFRKALVQLVLVKIRGLVGGLVLVGEFAHVLVAEAEENALDARTLGGQQLPGVVGFHESDPIPGLGRLRQVQLLGKSHESGILQLANPLPAETELLADRLERGGFAVEAEAKLEHPALALGKLE